MATNPPRASWLEGPGAVWAAGLLCTVSARGEPHDICARTLARLAGSGSMPGQPVRNRDS